MERKYTNSDFSNTYNTQYWSESKILLLIETVEKEYIKNVRREIDWALISEKLNSLFFAHIDPKACKIRWQHLIRWYSICRISSKKKKIKLLTHASLIYLHMCVKDLENYVPKICIFNRLSSFYRNAKLAKIKNIQSVLQGKIIAYNAQTFSSKEPLNSLSDNVKRVTSKEMNKILLKQKHAKIEKYIITDQPGKEYIIIKQN